jgi:hypothetical protein
VRRAAGLALILALAALPAAAQPVLPPELGGGAARGGAVLGLMGLNMTPDFSTNALEIRQASDSANPRRNALLQLGQTGVAGTLSDRVPLFVEGYLGWARYDPLAVLTAGERRTPAVRWNNLSATAGVGYDIRLNDRFLLRPIVHAGLGMVVSDAALLGWVLDEYFGVEADALRDRRAFVHGLGGSLSLAYSDWRPEGETDVELRYTRLRLETFGGTFAPVRGSLTAETIGLWGRHRWPTGWEALGRPLRWVVDGSASIYLGEQTAGLGFDWSVKVGAGIELDIGRQEIGVFGFNATRLRLVARYFFADRGVTGTSIGIGISF